MWGLSWMSVKTKLGRQVIAMTDIDYTFQLAIHEELGIHRWDQQ